MQLISVWRVLRALQIKPRNLALFPFILIFLKKFEKTLDKQENL